MGILPNSILLHRVQVENLVAYLKFTGWRLTKTSNDRWFVFEGASDIDDRPFEIVLPSDLGVRDFKIHLANAINLLCAVTEDSPENVVRKVKYYDRDVLGAYNLETGKQDSITLVLAARQVLQLKQLVVFAASSERDPRPHFDTPLSIGSQMAERYRFGHTSSTNSFGFTIESPSIGQSVVYEQLRLFPEDQEEVIILPFARRVMERIVRGLLATQKATKERDLRGLVNGYSSGFNSNMCKKIVRMSKGRILPLEYTVLWSPKLEPSDDVKDAEAVRLNETSYQLLDDAARELKELEPEYVDVRGMVTDLSSRGDPLGAGGIPRSVAINWANRPKGGRPVKVVVELRKEDYVVAYKAHLEWQTVEVTGIIQRVGNLWRLSDPQNFRVAR